MITDKELLDEFKINWELSYCWDDDRAFFAVHKFTGSVNDREWELIGRGDSPREAIAEALRSDK